MNIHLHTNILLCLVLLLAAGCTPAAPQQPVLPSPVPPELPTPFPSTAAIVDPSPLIQPPTALPVAPVNAGPLYLRVLWPEDGSLISVPEIELVGEATPGAVVSVGDEIFIIPADGAFREALLLEEGPNVIEIVASNLAGVEQTLILTIVYEP